MVIKKKKKKKKDHFSLSLKYVTWDKSENYPFYGVRGGSGGWFINYPPHTFFFFCSIKGPKLGEGLDGFFFEEGRLNKVHKRRKDTGKKKRILQKEKAKLLEERKTKNSTQV